MVLLLPVAESTIKISTKGPSPAMRKEARIIRRQPLKWGAVTFTVPVGHH
jgi:hypothetical protein